MVSPTSEKKEVSETNSVVINERPTPTTGPSIETLSKVCDNEEQTNVELDKAAKKKESIYRILTFLSLQMALFLGALDSTIIATSLSHIGSEFNQMEIASWVVTAYILTYDSFQPLFTKFSDIFGRKPVLLFGVSIFLTGSILCGAAQSMIMLIVFRAVSGIGAAAIFSMVFVIISDMVPLEKRGSYQGIINAVFATSSICGPLIGGTFTDYISWRWNFYINLPIGAVALVNLIIFLRLPTPKEKLIDKLKRIDYVGSVCVFSFATLFLLAMNFGGQVFPWKSTAVIIPLVLAALLVIALVVIETRFAKEPLLPPRIFKNRSAVSILILNSFFGITFYATLFFLPLFFQIVKGDSAMWSGVRLIPMQLILSLTCAVTGHLMSKVDSYRPVIFAGMTFQTIAVGLYSLFDTETSWGEVYGFTLIAGMGIGCIVGSTVLALQASVSKADIAVVTGLGNFARLLGGALGVAIAAAIQNSHLTQELPLVLPREYADKILQSSQFVRNGLPAEYFDIAIKTYVESFRLIWHVMIPMAGIALTCVLFTKHNSLRSQMAPVKESEEKNRSTLTPSIEHVVVDLNVTTGDDHTSKE